MALDPTLRKLLEDLKSPDDNVRIEAVKELTSSGTSECIPALEEARAKDENFVVQASAEKAIVKIREREEREKAEAAKRAEQEKKADLERKRIEAEMAAIRAEEEARRKAEVRIEEVLSEDEIDRIKREEIKRIELEKQQKAEELRKIEDQKRKEEARKKAEEEQQEALKRKQAEDMLREKVRAEAAKQKGLVEFQGEWLTIEEVAIREAVRKEEEEKKSAAMRRVRIRKKKENLEIIERVCAEKEKSFLLVFKVGGVGLVTGLITMGGGFAVWSPLIGFSMIILFVSVAMLAAMTYMIYEIEKTIYSHRVYDVEGETYFIKYEMLESKILNHFRKLALRGDKRLSAIFLKELEPAAGKGKDPAEAVGDDED